MKQGVTRHEGPDGFEHFLAFLDESGRHYNLSCQSVLRQNFSRVWDMLRPDFVASLLELHPFESLYGRASRYFESEQLRRAFTFATMYLGMSPFDAPGTYSLLQYAEFAEGIWYPIGGFQTAELRLDPSASPEGMNALVVLVPVGHLDDEDEAASSTKRQDPEYWTEVAERTKGKVLRAIEDEAC